MSGESRRGGAPEARSWLGKNDAFAPPSPRIAIPTGAASLIYHLTLKRIQGFNASSRAARFENDAARARRNRVRAGR